MLDMLDMHERETARDVPARVSACSRYIICVHPDRRGGSRHHPEASDPAHPARSMHNPTTAYDLACRAQPRPIAGTIRGASNQKCRPRPGMRRTHVADRWRSWAMTKSVCSRSKARFPGSSAPDRYRIRPPPKSKLQLFGHVSALHYLSAGGPVTRYLWVGRALRASRVIFESRYPPTRVLEYLVRNLAIRCLLNRRMPSSLRLAFSSICSTTFGSSHTAGWASINAAVRRLSNSPASWPLVNAAGRTPLAMTQIALTS